VEADIGSHLRILERPKPGGDVGCVGSRDRAVAGEPAARAAMAGFAADAVGKLERRAPQTGRRGVGVTAEAFPRLLGRPDAQLAGDRLAARFGQDTPGAAVGAGGARTVLPGDELVLPNGDARFDLAAMAGRSRAGGHALVHGAHAGRLRGGPRGLT